MLEIKGLTGSHRPGSARQQPQETEWPSTSLLPHQRTWRPAAARMDTLGPQSDGRRRRRGGQDTTPPHPKSGTPLALRSMMLPYRMTDSPNLQSESPLPGILKRPWRGRGAISLRAEIVGVDDQWGTVAILISQTGDSRLPQ